MLINKNELKPCPYCGNKELFVDGFKLSKGYKIIITCRKCISSLQVKVNDVEQETINEIIKTWNGNGN